MDKNIKIIPRWWRLVPFLGADIATTIYPNIFLPIDVYENIKSESPGVREQSILLHEKVHIRRQRELGPLIWNLKYVFLRSFRLNEELVAIKEQMQYLKTNNQSYDCENKAKQLASSTYLWVTSYEKGLDSLSTLWQSI